MTSIMNYDDSVETEKRKAAFLFEMNSQSDRGVAIVGAAWVENALMTTIKSFLRSESKAWVDFTEGNGPLSSFSAKIDLARLLGIITETIRLDLHNIRRVRNDFAHQIAHKTEYTILDFNSSDISKKCMVLKCVAHQNHTEPRKSFIYACWKLAWEFEMFHLFGAKVSSDGAHIFADVERH